MTNWTGVLQTAIPVGGLLFFFWPLRKYIDSPSFHGWLRNFRGRAAVKTPMGEAAIEVAEQQASSKNPADAELLATMGDGASTTAALPSTEPKMAPASRVGIQILEDELSAMVEALEADTRTPVLIRALAETRLRAGHEYVYNRIFGSQIVALKTLNQRGSISEADARREFEPLKTLYPDVYEKYSFEAWNGWLQRMGLVRYQNGFFEITALGRDFLMYLVETGLMENKPF